MILADVWLGEISLLSPEHRKLARALARTQAMVFKRYGHILDLRSEACRRIFSQRLVEDHIPGVTIHCVRCGAMGRTTQWMLAALLLEDNAAAWAEQRAREVGISEVAYARPCKGDELAAELKEWLK